MAGVPVSLLHVTLPPDTSAVPLPCQPGIPPSAEDVLGVAPAWFTPAVQQIL